ncbi:MAG: hypothetical protein ABJE95_09700 [Byssovorax sp.]
MYREEDQALRLRIETLEAKLAERDAMVVARDAELSELTARLLRLQPKVAAGPRARRLWPILSGAMALLVGASALMFTGMRPRPQAASARPAFQPKTSVGVPACDEYLFRIELCISGLGPDVRDALSTSLKATREAWWSAASTPKGREALAGTCEQALDTLAVTPLCE